MDDLDMDRIAFDERMERARAAAGWETKPDRNPIRRPIDAAEAISVTDEQTDHDLIAGIDYLLRP